MWAFIFLSLASVTSSAYCPLNDNGGPVSGPISGGPISGPISGGPISGPIISPVSGGTGYATYFDGFGIPYGGCGVPQSWLIDGGGKPLPFVALNTQFSGLDVPSHEEPIPASLIGMFDNGKNCGRWLKIQLKDTCKRGSNTNERVCIVGNTDGVSNYEPDADTGKIVYGYVADKCSDTNVWCRLDKYHIDLSAKSISEYIRTWGNRLVSWDFIDVTPPVFTFDSDVSFGWAADAYLPYYASVIVYNTKNGISRVNVRSKSGSMIAARPNGILGQMWILPWEINTGNSTVTIEVFDISGVSYGTWSVNFPCGDKCTVPTKANSNKLV